MVNLYYDRVKDGINIPNGIAEEHVQFYFPHFRPTEFRKKTEFTVKTVIIAAPSKHPIKNRRFTVLSDTLRLLRIQSKGLITIKSNSSF